ncbi:hypothetical protein PUH89_01660 [Rhodobacter capsulatus]|uniref:Uncharacterized protein n=1 Tax=Rhodobacter capsulatus TaxID=1061 RepID=A0A1G7FV39_RHOCA|nr:hypothetical protein [Rhodobacter capsulatus]WER09713.1 hypothetical protein PUH89_01660 [Rhodobacter capsulatus]SDE79756.1 hypothetical protein SAMN04244550_01116 [Rhodobacter capsulatus]
MKAPKWAQVVDTHNASYSGEEVEPCFKTPDPLGASFFLTVDFPWSEIKFGVESRSGKVKNQATDLFIQMIQLAQDCDLWVDASGFEIKFSKYLRWTNFETDTLVAADFNAEIGFQEGDYEGNWRPYFIAHGEVAIIGERREELYSFTSDEISTVENPFPISKTRLISQCKKFARIVDGALKRSEVSAPFGRLSDLPAIPHTSPRDIFDVVYIDRHGELVRDQLCNLKKSIYSLRSDAEISWICAYSNTERQMINFKICDFKHFSKLVKGQTGTGKTLVLGQDHVQFPWLSSL